MGNDGERLAIFEQQHQSSTPKQSRQQHQQIQAQQYYKRHVADNGQSPQRSGLLPTDLQDTYKRSSSRASRRTRNERTSYLMATGHLDPEETVHLNQQQPVESSILMELSSQSIASDANANNSAIPQRDNSEQQQIRGGPSKLTKAKRPNFEPSFLDNLNRALANSPVNGQGSFQNPTRDPRLTSHHNSSSSSSLPGSAHKKSNSKGRKSNKQQSTPKSGGSQRYDRSAANDRGKFRQTSYTEVTLPMKTSPAFDYILKDNRRRNKRCCLWLLYSTLMTICLALVVWASFMLARVGRK